MVGAAGYPHGRCIARTRGGLREDPNAPYDDLRCKRPAVEGRRVCQTHGGNVKNPGGRPPVHGRRSKYAGGAKFGQGMAKAKGLEPKIQEFLSDKNWMDLRREIATLRALLEMYLEKHEEDPHDEDVQKHVAKMADQIGILIDRLHKILFGEEYTINVYGIQAFAARTAEVINASVAGLTCECEQCSEGLLLSIYQGLDNVFGKSIEDRAQERMLLAPPADYEGEQ